VQLDWYGDSVPAHCFSLPQSCTHAQLDQPDGVLGSEAVSRSSPISHDTGRMTQLPRRRVLSVHLDDRVMAPSREFDAREQAPASVSPGTESAKPRPFPRVQENAQPASAVSTDGSSEKREPSTPLAFAYSKQPYRIPRRTRSEPTASPNTVQPRRSTLAGRKKAETQGSTEHHRIDTVVRSTMDMDHRAALYCSAAEQ